MFKDPGYTAYRDTLKDFEREGGMVHDDEYVQLAARDEADRLLGEEYQSGYGKRRPGNRAPFVFADNQ